MRKLIEAIKDSPFDYDLVGDEIDLHCYTPAGEDWHVYVVGSEDFKNYAENYCPDDDFEIWVQARHTDKSVPDIPTLWKDQLWKRDTLRALAEKL